MKHTKHYLVLFFLSVYSAVSAQFNYAEALQKSLLFYETQQSGILPDWNRISWRADAGINDGKDVGLDLTGGWHDAGDHIKFGFPMAYSVTALNWGFLEYKEGYDTAQQTEHFKRNIKWVTDYFIKCHPSPNEFYAQVADSKSQDHNFWMPAEMVDVHPMYGQRKAYKLSTTAPGTEVACETAAALASASIIFKESDPTYSQTLLNHALELYNFGDKYRGLYNEDGGIPATGTYSSGGYQDELCWGAIWLYKATGDQKWLTKAEAEYSLPDFLWSFVWDDKTYGNMVLLSIITEKANYIADSERHLDFWQPDGGVSYSTGGQAHLTQWGSSRHAMNAALTALIFSDKAKTTKKKQYHDFAVKQIEYVLGKNPMDRSLVTGFGKNPPTKPHHRGMHASWSRSSALPVESRHTLIGALMGGPIGPTDTFVEDRDDFKANEVATDYNACYSGVLARMVMEFGGTPLENYPQPETPGVEFLNEVKINGESGKYTEVSIWLNNRSAWPARVPSTLSARYFVDITEGVNAGIKPEDYQLTARGAGKLTNPNLQEWDSVNNIYYAEVEVDSDKMPFPGGMGEYRQEIQLRVELPTSADASAWDPTNDPSYSGLSDTLKQHDKVSIYVDGKLNLGDEPAGLGVLKAGFTLDKSSGIIPFTVNLDASKSRDPDGGALTYTWDFGKGEPKNGVTTDLLLDKAGIYTVTLTIENTKGEKATATKTIKALEEQSCAFGAPRSTPLPSFENKKFTGIYVIGNNGPDLSNMRDFSINWNSPNNGLYGLSMNSTDGIPDYYVDLLSYANHKFNQIEPEITISGSGITNFDDTYWVSENEGDFVMVSQTRSFTIYFSNSSEAPICGEKDNSLSVNDFEIKKITFYPNPINTLLTIQGININNSIVSIFSIKGISKGSFKINTTQNEFKYDTSHLENGVYLLQIKNKKGSSRTHKIVINHN